MLTVGWIVRYWNTLLISPPGYVGAATVAAAVWWFLYCDEGPMISFYQLVSIQRSNICVLLLQMVADDTAHAIQTQSVWTGFRVRAYVSVSPLSRTSCSAARATRSSLGSTARCLRPRPQWPWLCLCWSPSRCATLWTGPTTRGTHFLLRTHRDALSEQ